MSLSTQQEEALARIGGWLRTSDPIFNLNGYAGTGKTHLAQSLRSLTDRPVQYCSYTGKATVRLRQKGCDGAATIHSLFYSCKGDSEKLVELTKQLLATKDPDEQAKLRSQIVTLRTQGKKTRWALKEEPTISPETLLVVDESSMLSTAMCEDLLKVVRKVLLLGDPAQLPPVMGRSILDDVKRDFLLTEIRRQEADNPIIAAATLARKGTPLTLCDRESASGRFRYIEKDATDWDDYGSADQILVATNRTRRGFNRRYRDRMGRKSWFPEIGERIIILRNTTGLESPLFNGSILRVTACNEFAGELYVDGIDEVTGDAFIGLPIWEGCFRGEEADGCPRDFIPADFAYALTVHKAQGSEWGKVLVYYESVGNYHDQWLYTALTRAAKECTLVRAW